MERPQHELAALAAHGKKNKTMSLGLVIGIHVVIVSALIAGLSSNQIRSTIGELTATVITRRVTVQELPPPPISVVKPPPAIVPPLPKFEIAIPPKPVIPQTIDVVPPPAVLPTLPRAVARTHTTPPYPALSQRMGEQGTTTLMCDIGIDGKPIACTVIKSSGSQRLDDAAASYVKDHYTWQPATRDGKPVAGKTELDIVWDLKNAN
jgi:periplasmic protein TonB